MLFMSFMVEEEECEPGAVRGVERTGRAESGDCLP